MWIQELDKVVFERRRKREVGSLKIAGSAGSSLLLLLRNFNKHECLRDILGQND